MSDPLKIIGDFLRRWPNAEYGPGHIVFGDFNLRDSDLDFCLRECDVAAERGGIWVNSRPQRKELRATRKVLKRLKAIPELRRKYAYWSPAQVDVIS